MKYVLDFWSFDPMVIVAVAVVVLHEVGLARLRGRSRIETTRSRRHRSWVFYSGLGVLVLSIISPVDYFAHEYFFVHVIEHLLIMVVAPVLVVVGAPWTPLLFGIPVTARRRMVRAVARGSWFAPLRALRRLLARPVVAVVTFNLVMVLWQFPVLFDAAESNGMLHIWGMHGSMFLAGVAFWLQIVDSAPFVTRGTVSLRIGAIVGTNVVMFVLAMALSIFTNHSWYSAYAHVPGVTLSPFADQQIGAAILWICGDFWAAPALIYVIRRAVEQEGSLSDAVDRIFHRDPSPGLPGATTPPIV
jgi:putative membrane protein